MKSLHFGNVDDCIDTVPELPSENRAKLEELRVHFADLPAPLKETVGESDFLRFLRARDWDVSAAAQMLQHTLHFRDRFRVPGVLERPAPPGLDYLLSFFVQLTVPEGGVVRCEHFGRLLSSRLPTLFTEETYAKVQIYRQELATAMLRYESNAWGKPFESFSYVGVLHGLSTQARRSLWLSRLASRQDSDHYPGCAGKVFLVQTPSVFSALYAIVKPLVPFSVRQKLRIRRDDAAEELQREFYTTLPLEDTESWDRLHSFVRDRIAPSLPRPRRFPTDEEFETVNVPARTVTEILRVPVTKRGVRVIACLDNKDVQIKAEWSKPGENTRVLDEKTIEPGKSLFVVCTQPGGELVLTVDNSHSRWTSKDVLVYHCDELVDLE